MFAARPVAVFALNIGEIGETRIIRLQTRPVAGNQIGREGPPKLLGDVAQPLGDFRDRHVPLDFIEAAVDRIRIGIISDRVTRDAILVVVSGRGIGPAVDFSGKLAGVKRVGPRLNLVRRQDATAVCVQLLYTPERQTG